MEDQTFDHIVNKGPFKVKEVGLATIRGEKDDVFLKNECFSVRYSKSDKFIACGMSNGRIHLLDPSTHKNAVKIISSEFAITSLRFKGDNSLMSVSADGKVSTWHTLSGKKLHSFEEKGNPIMCLDINSDYSKFATGGNDKVVKLYDDDTKTLITELKPSYSEVGHSNRIFAVTFNKENPNILASGGWDSIVVFYDLRQSKIIGNALGAHICGDALDFKDNLVLTGSWRTKEQIKIFDLRKFKLLETVKWEFDKENKSSYIYSAQFSKTKSLGRSFAVGGSQENLWRIWDYETSDRSLSSGVDNLPGSAYTIDFANTSDNLVIGCGDSKLRIYSLEYNN